MFYSAFANSAAHLTISALLSLPLNHAVLLKYAYLFVEDVWLYNYDSVRYEGTMAVVFNTSSLIESMKFRVLDRLLGLLPYQQAMGFSEQYSNFTRPRFVEIEGSSAVLLEACFAFFVYTLPLTLACCLALYFLFLQLRQYKISQFLRKYFFIKATLFQTLLEGSVSYFVYVCLGNLELSFSFKFGDRLSLLFAVLFFWAVLLFSFAFYLLLGHYLRKRACYFIFCMYRSYEGHFYLTLRNLVRNLGRGAVFFFFHHLYPV